MDFNFQFQLCGVVVESINIGTNIVTWRHESNLRWILNNHLSLPEEASRVWRYTKVFTTIIINSYSCELYLCRIEKFKRLILKFRKSQEIIRFKKVRNSSNFSHSKFLSQILYAHWFFAITRSNIDPF